MPPKPLTPPVVAILAVLALGAPHPGRAAERAAAVPVTDDLVIRGNVVLKPGVYKVNDISANGVIQIAADNITLDGTGVVLVGTNFRGYGIRMNGHSGLTLRNFTIRGFDYGILLEDATQVLLEKNDVSGNRKDIQTGFLDIGCGAVSHNQLVANPEGNVRVTGHSTGVYLRRNDLSCPPPLADPSFCFSVLNQMDAGFDMAAARNSGAPWTRRPSPD